MTERDPAQDWRDMPDGPERRAAKTEAFRLAYSAKGEQELRDEEFVVRTPRPDFKVHGTITGRFHYPRYPRGSETTDVTRRT